MTATDQSFSPARLWAAVQRRRIPALLLSVALFAAAAVAAVFWPPSYSSTGTILIEQQELPTDLVRSTVSTYASQRIQVISQRVMTTENLMRIIERYELYADLRKRHPREEIIARMRRDTSLQMISADVIDPRDGRPTKATIAFSLTYSNRSPQVAAQVANELVSLYLQQNIETRQKTSHDAVAFLGGESARLNNDIETLQGKLAAFKTQHANELPELNQLNLQGMSRMEDEVRSTDAQLQSLEQQLVYLDAQLAQINPTAQVYTSTGERVQSPADLLKALRSEYTRATALYSPEYPDVLRLKREIEGLEASTQESAVSAQNDYRRQLQEAQTQLASARQRYAPDHPDVVGLQKLVNSLQSALAATQGNVAASSAAGATADSGDAAVTAAGAGADNPIYIQLRTQREAAVNERKALQDKRVSLQAKLDEYEHRLAQTPTVERDYTEIIRDLNSAQAQYADIRRKQMEADVAENLEEERKGERFTLIEPPFAAEEPTSPNRRMIVGLGLVVALGAALGLVLLLESMDGSVRGVWDLQRLVSVPPLAVIPIMRTHDDRQRRRRWRRQALYGMAAGMLVAVALVHFLYRPLDVIWLNALHRLGIES